MRAIFEHLSKMALYHEDSDERVGAHHCMNDQHGAHCPDSCGYQQEAAVAQRKAAADLDRENVKRHTTPGFLGTATHMLSPTLGMLASGVNAGRAGAPGPGAVVHGALSGIRSSLSGMAHAAPGLALAYLMSGAHDPMMRDLGTMAGGVSAAGGLLYGRGSSYHNSQKDLQDALLEYQDARDDPKHPAHHHPGIRQQDPAPAHKQASGGYPGHYGHPLHHADDVDISFGPLLARGLSLGAMMGLRAYSAHKAWTAAKAQPQEHPASPSDPAPAHKQASSPQTGVPSPKSYLAQQKVRGLKTKVPVPKTPIAKIGSQVLGFMGEFLESEAPLEKRAWTGLPRQAQGGIRSELERLMTSIPVFSPNAVKEALDRLTPWNTKVWGQIEGSYSLDEMNAIVSGSDRAVRPGGSR